MKVEVAVLGSPSLTVLCCLCGREATINVFPRARQLCEGRGDRPGLPVPNSPYGLCGRKATLDDNRQFKLFQYILPSIQCWTLWEKSPLVSHRAT